MKNIQKKIVAATAALERKDDELANELAALRQNDEILQSSRQLAERHPALEGSGGLEGAESTNFALETIVLATGRPVLAIHNDAATLSFSDARSEFWRSILSAAALKLSRACKAVGRIDLHNMQGVSWVGTGWLVDEDIIVTNRHVAEVFAREKSDRFVFRAGLDRTPVKPWVDFKQEHDNAETLLFELKECLYMAAQDGPDIAFLRVLATDKSNIPAKIQLARGPAVNGRQIAVVGYPAKDSRIPDQDLMTSIFGDVYDKKRLAPGTITHVENNEIHHDCSTLGGNSGSVLIDIETGDAVGIHFAGTFLDRNYAVPSNVIQEHLNLMQQRHESGHHGKTTPAITAKQISQPVNQAADPAGSCTINFNIPVSLTVSLGMPMVLPVQQSTQMIASDDEEVFLEGKPEDYADRDGYTADFLGDAAQVPLPGVTGKLQADDVLFWKSGQSELKYRHFSVVMSESRRICYFSAVNIDGNSSISMKRSGWRLDPRIDNNEQIIKECYGNSPKFSRGHMTRREDPIWGPLSVASQGNDDSMHVTNTVPQMQTLNGVIWLALENYALQNARKSKSKISVFTGPVLKENDPFRYDVQIPLSFWKVIAFIHDETNQLCATGYWMSQESHMKGEEYVYGAHNEEQVSIKWIEEQTGIFFNGLADLDPLKVVKEGIVSEPLTDFKQIKFF